jgi:D-alanine-D-alanine ligase-like ATP-grasp enzyme
MMPASAVVDHTRRRPATTRVAFVRSIEIQQAAPYLEPLRRAFTENDIEAKLFYTDGDVGPGDWPGPAERMPTDVSPAELTRRVLEWGADGFVSLSIPDENSLRDALAAEQLAFHGVETIVHSVETTELLSNKWATKQAVLAAGLDTPDGLLIDGDLLNGRCLPVPAYADALTRNARRLGFPLLTKPLWDCLGNGIRYLADERAWESFLAHPFEGNAVLEQCVRGELCSVEIIGRRGHYVMQPVVWKGPTGDSPTFAFQQLRYSAPRPAPDRHFAEIQERLLALCDNLGVNGAIEVEMIYHRGRFTIIEINPRVSGSTGLSIAASGCNTYLCLLDMLLDRWPITTRSQAPQWRLACQFPTAPLDSSTRRQVTSTLPVERASTFTVDGESYANMLMACDPPSGADHAASLRRLSETHDLLAPDVLAQVTHLLTYGRLPSATPHRLDRDRPQHLRHPGAVA